MKNRRSKSSSRIIRRQGRKALVLLFALFAFAALSYWAGAEAFKMFITAKPFALRKVYANVRLRELGALRRRFAGKSIFKVNIASIERYLSSRHPEFKRIEVRRDFPNKIIITAERRKPYAQVKEGFFYYLIDSQAVVVSPPRTVPYRGYIVVYAGTDNGASLPKGKKLQLDNFSQARYLINYFRAEKFFSRYVTALNICARDNIWFDLGGIKVKIGGSDYAKRLDVLRRLILPRFKGDWQKISYIDLRFKDPVVGYKR